MNPLNVIRGFDPDLYAYFEKELEYQRLSLSFIPDENSTSPLCAAIMGSVLVNTIRHFSYNRVEGLEPLAAKRICELFKADHANVRPITIEAASRVVFQSLTRRGDVVMSLDLRKKEHCNSENLAYRFVNFGVDPQSGKLDMDAVEKQALECKPQLIIVSPINYPLSLDYERFADIAHKCGAILWCDISQTAGLIAGGVLPSPLPYADVVTFSAHGAMQGPHSSVILCSNKYASSIDRMAITAGHNGLQSAELAALAARMSEMKDPVYSRYVHTVVDNAKALAEGLAAGGAKVLFGGTDSHLVIIDTKGCAVSARGAQELLMEAGVNVRICTMLTSDPNIKYDAVRFSTLPSTTRGANANQMREMGKIIAQFLQRPDEAHIKELKEKVSLITVGLPAFYDQWLSDIVRENLSRMSYMTSDSTVIRDSVHPSRLSMLTKKLKNKE